MRDLCKRLGTQKKPARKIQLRYYKAIQAEFGKKEKYTFQEFLAILGKFDEFLARSAKSTSRLHNTNQPNSNAPNPAHTSSLSHSVKKNKNAISRTNLTNNTNTNTNTDGQSNPDRWDPFRAELTYLALARRFGNTSIPQSQHNHHVACLNSDILTLLLPPLSRFEHYTPPQWLELPSKMVNLDDIPRPGNALVCREGHPLSCLDIVYDRNPAEQHYRTCRNCSHDWKMFHFSTICSVCLPTLKKNYSSRKNPLYCGNCYESAISKVREIRSVAGYVVSDSDSGSYSSSYTSSDYYSSDEESDDYESETEDETEDEDDTEDEDSDYDTTTDDSTEDETETEVTVTESEMEVSELELSKAGRALESLFAPLEAAVPVPAPKLPVLPTPPSRPNLETPPSRSATNQPPPSIQRLTSFYSIDEEVTTEDNEWLKECRLMGIPVDREVRELQKARVAMHADPNAPAPEKKLLEGQQRLTSGQPIVPDGLECFQMKSNAWSPEEECSVDLSDYVTNARDSERIAPEKEQRASSTTQSSSTRATEPTTNSSSTTSTATSTKPGDVIDVTIDAGETRERIKLVRFHSRYDSPDFRKARVLSEKEEMEKVYNERLKEKAKEEKAEKAAEQKRLRAEAAERKKKHREDRRAARNNRHALSDGKLAKRDELTYLFERIQRERVLFNLALTCKAFYHHIFSSLLKNNLSRSITTLVDRYFRVAKLHKFHYPLAFHFRADGTVLMKSRKPAREEKAPTARGELKRKPSFIRPNLGKDALRLRLGTWTLSTRRWNVLWHIVTVYVTLLQEVDETLDFVYSIDRNEFSLNLVELAECQITQQQFDSF